MPKPRHQKSGIRVTKWPEEEIVAYREWHEQKIVDMYGQFPALLDELRGYRETFLAMVSPR